MKLHWKLSIYGVIFCALFVFSVFSGETRNTVQPSEAGEAGHKRGLDELELLKQEFSLLRRQFSEVLLKYEEMSDRLLRYELGALGLLDGDPDGVSDERIAMLVRTQQETKALGSSLKSKALALDSFVGEILKKDKLEELDKVRLKCRMDELVSDLGRLDELSRTHSPRGMPSVCRVKLLDDALQIAVLDAGYAHGMKCGLVCTSDGGNRVVMKLVSVRAFSSAAMLLEGEMKDIVPGMNIKIGMVR